MTPREVLHSYVALPNTHAKLHAYVRRRGVVKDPEDMVQAVLCDALAVQAVPGEPDELPRFLNTIAKRRVADWYRRRRGRCETDLPELPVWRDPEVRDLLCRVNQELEGEAERATLSWLLREHAGESLKDIARELSMDARALRQRVCRLRRYLRARYLGSLAIGLAVLFGAVSFLETVRSPEPAMSRGVHGFDGHWRIAASSKADSTTWALGVTVRGSRVQVTAPGGRTLMTLWAEPIDEHTWLVQSKDGQHRVRVVRDTNRVRLSTPEGFLVLERSNAR